MAEQYMCIYVCVRPRECVRAHDNNDNHDFEDDNPAFAAKPFVSIQQGTPDNISAKCSSSIHSTMNHKLYCFGMNTCSTRVKTSSKKLKIKIRNRFIY